MAKSIRHSQQRYEGQWKTAKTENKPWFVLRHNRGGEKYINAGHSWSLLEKYKELQMLKKVGESTECGLEKRSK